MAEPWLNLLQTFGLAVTVLVAIALALWRIAVWTGREVVIPLRDKWLTRWDSFLADLSTALVKLDANLSRMAATVEQQARTLERCQLQARTLETLNMHTREEREKAQNAVLFDDLKDRAQHAAQAPGGHK